jgi:hypothetical protein
MPCTEIRFKKASAMLGGLARYIYSEGISLASDH